MIQRLHFSIEIKAEKTKIWDALWNENSYRDWIAVFSEGSYAVAESWKEGSKVLFLDTEKNGIYSIIQKHIPNKIMEFKHMGTIVKGQEQSIDDEVKKWSGAIETYTLKDKKDHNKLSVAIDVLDEHLDFMKNRFPIALQKIKDNSK